MANIRLNPTPGQWQPIPKVGKRMVDKNTGAISVHMEYPWEEINRKGFNPVIYPDLKFSYTTRVEPAGKGFKIVVDLGQRLTRQLDWQGGFQFRIAAFCFIWQVLLHGQAVWYFSKDNRIHRIIQTLKAKHK